MLQSEAMDILKLGHNVYLTGAAGSGKTYILNEFIKYLRDASINVGVTASTGIAATHMNGMTIHSWAGIGIKDELSPQDIADIKSKSRLKKRFNEVKILIIDEVSMLHGKRLDMVDEVCRAFKDTTKPFGGLQVVLSGDLFQLPPVTRSGPVDFVFESRAWKNMNLKICYLAEQYRQDDQRLLDVLSAIRAGDVDESHYEHLRTRFTAPKENSSVTKLYTHNEAVDKINKKELVKINSPPKSYTMQVKGNKKVVAALMASCLAPEVLTLKLGAEVMFVTNDPGQHYVNGTLGSVADFSEDGNPIIKTKDRTIGAKPYTWVMEDGEKIVAQISQLPLRLAWAITVHKSQGMSLDAAEVDLARSFEPGMGYVALSRVRDMEGLFIKGINNTALMVNPAITKLDVRLRLQSDKAGSELEAMSKEQIEKHHKQVRLALRSDEAKLLEGYDKALFSKLKTWRTKQAKVQSVPAYVVLSDKSLKFLSAIKPQTKDELARIHGIGDQKLERYGEDLLALIVAK